MSVHSIRNPAVLTTDLLSDLIRDRMPSPSAKSFVPDGFLTLHQVFRRSIENIALSNAPSRKMVAESIAFDLELRRWIVIRLGVSLWNSEIDSCVFVSDSSPKSVIPSLYWEYTIKDAANLKLYELVMNKIVNTDTLIGMSFGVYEGNTAVISEKDGKRFVMDSATEWKARFANFDEDTKTKEERALQNLRRLAIASRDRLAPAPLGVQWRESCGLGPRAAVRVWGIVAQEFPHLSSKRKPRRGRTS
jgi:hypothetical protein